jgi:hypothetical protein
MSEPVGRMNEGSRGEVTLGGVTERLLGSEEPAVRYKVLTKVLRREPASVAVLREEIRVSPRVKRLLSERNEERYPSTLTPSGTVLTGCSRAWLTLVTRRATSRSSP